jgi:xanthine dehydrogenase accessory factor
MKPYVLTWGGGDLASGVAIRLHRVGIRVLVVETDQPAAVRRSVAFAQAVYDGETTIEDVHGKLIDNPERMETCWADNSMPVLVDPDLNLLPEYRPVVLVDSRMQKIGTSLSLDAAGLMIGLGPGFTAGENCHAAVETNRGHFLGRVFWVGRTEGDTGFPGKVGEYAHERVLYTPVAGRVETFVEIGEAVNTGDLMLKVAEHEMRAPFPGVVRGLIHPGLIVQAQTKVGDIDPRPEAFRCWSVSEKSLAIGGGVLEAVLTRPEIRARLWET